MNNAPAIALGFAPITLQRAVAIPPQHMTEARTWISGIVVRAPKHAWHPTLLRFA